MLLLNKNLIKRINFKVLMILTAILIQGCSEVLFHQKNKDLRASRTTCFSVIQETMGSPIISINKEGYSRFYDPRTHIITNRFGRNYNCYSWPMIAVGGGEVILRLVTDERLIKNLDDIISKQKNENEIKGNWMSGLAFGENSTGFSNADKNQKEWLILEKIPLKSNSTADLIDLVNFDRFTDPSFKSEMIAKAKISDIARKKKEVREREERNAKEKKIRLEAQEEFYSIERKWGNLSSKTKFVGESVCSLENEFGYVEYIQNNKIKVLVVGKSSEPNLFLGRKSNIRFDRINRYKWFNSDELASCPYGD